MENLILAKDNPNSFTVLSNLFIDEYLTDANEAQIKVYLFLLRNIQCEKNTGVSEMADIFNFSEKDVIRALKYWEKKKLLKLSFNDKNELSCITMLAIAPSGSETVTSHADKKPLAASIQPEKTSLSCSEDVSLDEIKSFKKNAITNQIIMIAEQYIGRTLSTSDMKSIVYINKSLNFDNELIDYLLQYCVGKDKRDFRYIESVARNWYKDKITTVEQAQNNNTKFDSRIYKILNSLGKTNAPTDEEASFVKRWFDEFGFDEEMIKYACSKTVIAADSHRLEYCEGILKKWLSSGILTLEAAKQNDAEYSKQKSNNKRKSVQRVPKFAQFAQRDYDYDALVKELAN